MRVSELFKQLGTNNIANRVFNVNDDVVDINDLDRLEVLALEIASAPVTPQIEFYIIRGDKAVLRVGGVENSEDVFKTMELADLANLGFDFQPKMAEAVKILEDYSFFRM